MSKHTKKKKRTPNKSRVKKSPLKLINLFIIVLSVILLGIITNTFIGQEDKKEQNTSIPPKLINNENNQDIHMETISHEKFEEKTKALEIEYVDINTEHIINKTQEVDPYQFIYDDPIESKESKKPDSRVTTKEKIITPQKRIQTTQKEQINKKPKLVIIIDDVSSSRQVRAIKKIGYPVTMAFLPPTKGHKNSAKIAKEIDIYMVHLPLEATNKSFEEQNTLHIGDSLEKIDKRIQEIQKYYPNTKFINNHTGSKFTSDFESMDKLFSVLKKYNYIFIDSKTTANTVTKQVAQKHNMPYISRNIFLDNRRNKEYIQKQLKKAIKIAQKTGFAIAIGHPHKETITTLKDSKYLLKDIELIQINKINL